MPEDRQLISSGSPYEPVIGFSRAVRVGNVVSVSGTAAIGADGSVEGPGDAYAQTVRILAIIGRGLEVAGATLEHVVRTRIYVTDMVHWEHVARAHGDVFGEIRPASTIVQVVALIDPAMLVEIEADAIIPA